MNRIKIRTLLTLLILLLFLPVAMHGADSPAQNPVENLVLEARPVSAGAVELRWNREIDAMLERRAPGEPFEMIRRMSGQAGTLGNVPLRAWFERGLAADTHYTFRLVVPNGWRYDFGPKSAPAAQDHLRVSGTEIFSEDRGYGFVKPGRGDRGIGHNPRNRDNSFVEGATPFTQNLPDGHYLVSLGARAPLSVTINGISAMSLTKGTRYQVLRFNDFPVQVTDGKLTVEIGGSREWCYLNIVPRDQPVRALAQAACKTFSIAHMVDLLGNEKEPLPVRLAALYSLGDMGAAAATAAPAIADIFLRSEKGAMHWLALWSLWKIGEDKVNPGQWAAVRKMLARFEKYDKALLPAPARCVIQEANADRPLFGQYQMCLPAWYPPGEKLPPKVTDEKFFGRWNTVSNDWVMKPVVQYEFSPNLNPVREAAMRGDYDQAKKELLAYYRDRKDIPRPETKPMDEAEKLGGEGVLRGVLSGSPVVAFTVKGGWQWYTVDLLTSSVARAYVILDWERAGTVGIRSRENAGYAPRLEIVTDKNRYEIEAQGDTYIRAGKYANENYGTKDLLMVQEGKPPDELGNPVSDDTMRTYIGFSVPASINTGSEKILSSRLKLYAQAMGQRQSVSLAVFPERASTMEGREKSMTWGNTTVNLSIYQNQDFFWHRTPGAERQAKYWIPRGAFPGGIANAYAVTGNEQYAYTAVFRALDFWSKQRNDFHFKVDTGKRLIDSAEALLTLKSEFVTPDVWCSLLKAYYEHARVMSGEPGGPGNASRSIQYGWLLFNTYFPELSQPGWWKANIERQTSNVRSSLAADGSYCEATTGYIRGTMLAMQESVDLVKKVRGILLPAAEPYGQLAEYYMNCTTPAGTLYNWGPGSRANVRSYVLEAGETLNNPYLIYFGSKGQRGSKPPYYSKLYPIGKTFHMRTSWVDENGLGAFINARVGGGHSDPDDLDLDIYGFGRYLLADPGPGSYNVNDPAGAWQSGTTIAHNTITIDGKNQARSGNSDIQASTGQIFDYVTAWVESYGNARRVYRRVLFVRPMYWIVSDYIRAAEGAHTYDQAWHPDEGSHPVIDPKTQRMQTHFETGANVQIVPPDPAELKGEILDGWMEGRRAKYLTYRKSGVTGDTTFDAVIYPTKQGDNTTVSVERLPVRCPNGELSRTSATALKISIGKNRTGYYYQSYLAKPAKVEFGNFIFDGETAYFEIDSTGTMIFVALRNGRTLSNNTGQTRYLVQSSTPLEELGCRLAQGTLDIETSRKSSDLTIRATVPVKKVTLNGIEVPFAQTGDTLRIQNKVRPLWLPKNS